MNDKGLYVIGFISSVTADSLVNAFCIGFVGAFAAWAFKLIKDFIIKNIKRK